MSNFWDERYAKEEYAYGKEPNAYFKLVIDKLPAGQLLVPGAGEGRDAVYAAKLGWDVLAFDQSAQGREKALRLAAEQNVTIQYDLMDVADFITTPESFDAVALIYFHLPERLRTDFHNKITGCLRPDGAIILEAFNPKQLQNTSGGPKEASMLITSALLQDEFADLSIKNNEEIEVSLNEGQFHFGKADVVRFLATKHIR